MRRGGKSFGRCGAIVLRQPVGNVNAEISQQTIEKLGPANRDSHVADGVFDDQVPADDPRDQLAECRIRVGVS